MAGSILIPLKAVFDNKGVIDAQKQFNKLGGSLKGVVGALGVTVGITGLVNVLRDASKAAVEDTKSQALLAQQLRNTTGATDSQISAVEQSISAMQLSASVADDVLRPAFAQLVRATGDLGTATKLTQLALDVSAGTGRDLGAVSIALSRAYGGNTTALSRLGIKAQEGVNIFDQLQTQFGGAAEAAAQNDPYQRLTVIFGEIQEKIGIALLPELNKLADFFASPAGQKELTGYANLMKELAGVFIFLGTTVAEFLAGFRVVGTAFGKLFAGDFKGFIDLMNSRGMVEALSKLDSVGTTAQSSAKAVNGLTLGGVGRTGGTGGSGRTGGNATPKKTAAQIAAEKAAEALKKAKEALKDFQDGLKDLSSGFEPLTQASSDLGEFQRSVLDTFDSINKKIAEGVANKTIASKGLDNLRNFLKAQQNLLEENARQRDAIIEKRSLTKALFDDVKSSLMGTGSLASLLETQTRQVTKSVTKIVDGFTVTTRQTVDEVVGGQGVVSKLKEVVARTKAFATQLTSLKALGLNPDLFKQIVDAGPEVGGQLANEILAGGSDSVKALNDTFTELQTVTASVAEQTAVVMFNAGVDIAGGLVNGLLAQEAALVAAAKTLADAFNAEFQAKVNALQTPAMAETRTQTFKLGDLAKIDLKTVTGDDAWKASAALAKKLIASPQYTKGSQIMITVNAGVGTNGKTVGQAIQAELNKYAKSSSK
jgi:hypothetical protein